MDIINNAKVGEIIDVYRISGFKTVKFTHSASLGYTWCADSVHHHHTIFPMATHHNVKFFKTLAGAKRNFIKRIE